VREQAVAVREQEVERSPCFALGLQPQSVERAAKSAATARRLVAEAPAQRLQQPRAEGPLAVGLLPTGSTLPSSGGAKFPAEIAVAAIRSSMVWASLTALPST
jgi:hypothetical protein